MTEKIYVYDKKGSFVTEIVPKNPTDACYFGGDDVMIFKEITVTGEVVESGRCKGVIMCWINHSLPRPISNLLIWNK